MRFLLAAAALVVIVAGLREAAPLLIPLVISLFVAVACFPLVQWLRRFGVPAAAAVLITVLAVLAALMGPGALAAAAVRQFVIAAPRYQQQLLQGFDATLGWLGQYDIDTVYLRGLINPGQVFDLTVGTLSGVVTFLSVSLLIVFVSAFMLAYLAALVGPPGASAAATGGPVLRIVREVQVYLLVKTLISLATGLTAWLWLSVLGVDFAMVWGLLTFLLNYVPNIGSVVAAVPPVLLALVQHGSTTAGLVLAGYFGLNALWGTLVEPNLMGRRLRIAPLAVLLSVIVWGWIWGAAGMLLSVPMTMIIKIGLENSQEFSWIADLLEGRRPRGPAA